MALRLNLFNEIVRRLFVVFRARNLDAQTVRKKGCHESREGRPEQDGDERVVGHCKPQELGSFPKPGTAFDFT